MASWYWTNQMFPEAKPGYTGHTIASHFGQILGLKNTTHVGLLKKPVWWCQSFSLTDRMGVAII